VNSTELDNGLKPVDEPHWRVLVAPFRNSSLWISIWQLTNTFIPFFLTWYLMYLSLNYSYWITLGIAPLVGGFQLRMFIIFHDCGHQSFFKSKRANDIIGSITGVLCFTPYYHWRYLHALHHATVGNLSRRVEGELLPMTIKKYAQNNGDVFTLTVNEYQQLSRWEKFIYHLYRNPFVLLMFMPLFLFLVLHRLSHKNVGKRERYSVIGTNVAILTVLLVLGYFIGFGPLLLVEIPIVIFSTCTGVWMFYIQHQFEESYWESNTKWSFETAALRGSSYYKLPGLFQWFTGNIGFHHIHHLNPRIPNYNLQKCHKSNALFRDVSPVTIKIGMKSLFLRLWDEEQNKMVGFNYKKFATRKVKNEVLSDE